MNIGILGASRFAKSNIIPSIESNSNFSLIAVASRRPNEYGQIIDYHSIIDDESIDIVYIPLPPGKHFEFARKCLERGKHVIIEKPITLSIKETELLIKLAKKHNLFIAENYVFQFHKQWQKLTEIIKEFNEPINRVVVDFTFPLIENGQNFRYNENLGGGGWMDAGAYGLKALLLLGILPKLESAHVSKRLNNTDIAGVLNYSFGETGTSTITYGMSNAYRSEMTIELDSCFIILEKPFSTKPTDNPGLFILKNGVRERVLVGQDNQYLNALENYFANIENSRFSVFYEEIARMDKLRQEAKHLLV